MRTSLRAGVLAAVLVVGASACSGDDADDASTTTEPTTITTKAELAAYCDAAEGYVDAVDIETETVPETIAGLEAAAAAARTLADTAPPEVQAAHEAIATSAEALVAALKEADPQTLDELGEVGGTITEALVEQYGALDEEVATFSTFAKAQCGLELGADAPPTEE